MMRANYLNSHVYPVGKKMTGSQHITIFHVCSTDESESEEFPVEKTLPQICYMNKDKSKIIIVDESSTEDNESECLHKSINREKYANNEANYEEPSITYDPVVKELSYFNIFECGKNLLNKLESTRKRACMATPRDKYNTKIYETLVDYNDHNNAPFSNENI